MTFLQQEDLQYNLYSRHGALLRFLCAGKRTSRVVRLLAGWPEGICPAPKDTERAKQLELLLRCHPRVALLACGGERGCICDGEPLVHACVRSVSIETLKVLVAWLHKLVGLSQTSFLLALPNAKGETALDIALGAQMWDFVNVLAPSASHVRACILYMRLLTVFQTSSLKRQRSYQQSLSGAVGGTLNKLWDGFGGSFKDSDVVRGHKTLRRKINGLDHVVYRDNNEICHENCHLLSTTDDILKVRQQLIDKAVKRYGLHPAEATRALQSSGGWRVDQVQSKVGTQVQVHSQKSTLLGAKCIICFEYLAPSTMFAHQLPCEHVTCKVCWQAFLESRVNDGCLFPLSCPHPGCGLPFDMVSVERLLDIDTLDPKSNSNSKAMRTKIFKKYKALLAEGFVAACPSVKWCPGPKCGSCLLLLTNKARVTRNGITITCPSCNQMSCWYCNELGDHEPASCGQMANWRRQLEVLKAAAPESSRIWLQRNTRQCPVCGSHVQRHGGCNHMTCPCGAQWCWECRRPWREHGTETGGFYFCNLEDRSEEGGEDGGKSNTEGQGWLRQAWSSLVSLASHDMLERAVQQHIRNECDENMLFAVARHLERLIPHVTNFCCPGLSTNTSVLNIDPDDLATMDAREWSECMSAACTSLVECSFSEKAQPSCREDGIARDTLHSSSLQTANVKTIAALVVEGHRALQSAAAVLWDMSGGPRRRYLLELCHAVEECLMRVESVLVHLPHRQCIPATPESSGSIESTTNFPQSWTRGVQGAIANCTKSLFSIPLPSDDSSPRIEGIAVEALVAQVYYACAFVHSYKHLGGKEEVDRLGEAVAALKRAGRDGLFVS